MNNQEFLNKIADYVKEKIKDNPDTELIIMPEKFKIKVKVNSGKSVWEMSLTNFVPMYEDKLTRMPKEQAMKEICEQIYDTFVLFQGELPTWENVKNRIYPQIRQEGQFKPEYQIISRPLVGDLILHYVVDYDMHIMSIGSGHLEKWNITEAELIKVAHENFLRDKDIPFERHNTKDGTILYTLNTNDGYDATRIILTHRLQEIADKHREKLIIAVPNRDIITITPTNSSKNKKAVEMTTRVFNYSKSHPLSTQLFTLYDGQLLRTS